MIGDSGPYASVGMKVLERAAGHASGPYHVPAIDVESIAVRTNNPVCGAFRGFGANQAQFAMEGVIDRLAERGRHQRLGDPRPQRHRRRATCGGRARSWTTAASAPAQCLDAVKAALRRRARRRQGRRARARPEELRARQRVQGDRQGGRALRRPTARSRCATAGPRWARASTPSRCRSRSRSSASTRTIRVDRRHDA